MAMARGMGERGGRGRGEKSLLFFLVLLLVAGEPALC